MSFTSRIAVTASILVSGCVVGAARSMASAESAPQLATAEAAADPQLITLRRVTGVEQQRQLRRLVRRHYQLAGSPRAKEILDDWQVELGNFWLVLPKEAVATIEAANEGAGKEEAEKQASR